MADSSIAVDAGSDANVDTRTEGTNGNHRQVIVIGDPSSNAGIATVDATNGLAVHILGDALTALQLIDNIVSGNEAQVDIVAPLPAGSNAIGKLAANDGVDIGNVDVTSILPGSAATNLGKAEDAAHSSGDVGVAILGVRRDSKSAGAGTDGDYSTINLNAAGDLRVDGGQVFAFESAPTVTAGAYTADDCIGGEIEITNAARVSGGGGVLMQISMGIEDNDADGFVANDIDVIIFKSNPAGTYTDNTALAVTDADAFEIEGVVTLDTKLDLGDVTLLQANNVNLPYVCDATSLFAVAVNRGGKTPEATDAIQLRFKMLRD